MSKDTNNNLKKTLKLVKLNESSISMALGILVILIVGFLTVKYLKNDRGSIPQETSKDLNSVELSQKVHKVQKGENLWQIAVNYYGDGFKWVDIATENKLTNASIIEIDQELILPEIENTKVTADNLSTDTSSNTSYTIIKGDSLWNIAVKEYGDGYKWVEIARENKIPNPNIIYSGNILILPR